jgi:hypothetical protein
MLVVRLTALAATPLTLGSPEFNTLNVSSEVARFCNEHLAQQLTERGVQVTTARQIGAVLGAERQRQLLGCDEGACTAELTDALGAEGLVLGDLGRLGTTFQVNLKVVSSRTSKVVATWSGTAAREEDLLQVLNGAASELAPKILVAFGRVDTTHRTWPLAPTLVAGGLLVVGAVCEVLTVLAHSELVSKTGTPLTARAGDDLALRGQVTQWTQVVAFSGAGVAALTAMVLYLVSGKPADVHVGLNAGPAGAGLLVEGRF